jgi:hypothetical protein
VVHTLLATTLSLALSACATPPAKTWDDICERVAEGSDSVRVAPDAEEGIRDQVAAAFHQHYVEHAKKSSSLSPEATERVTAELVRLRTLGAWREGRHLHLADFYLFALDEGDKPLERWRDHLEVTLFSGGSDRTCLGESVRLLFDDVTLHQGAGEQTLVMKLKESE